jgi:hypothetical protein
MTVEQIMIDDQENGSLIFNCGIAQRLNADISSYAEICGGFYDGVHQWISHNVVDVNEVENSKFRGYTITTDTDEQIQLYIPMWVLNKDVGSDWKFAKNMFCKFLKRKL